MPGLILIVEDSDLCVTTLELALAGIEDLETWSTRVPAEALAMLTAGTWNVRAIVTDLQLPSMDGFEFIERVRRRNPRATLPIVVTSGDSDPDNSKRLDHLGTDAYFVKPYSPAALRRTLERLLHAT